MSIFKLIFWATVVAKIGLCGIAAYLIWSVWND